ncbi:hypothetical protein [Caulobacter sp. X]|uniref:hypothetical protein n=1 Tax=Caulobacter sp. X TaxID=2048901 RepID=UPI000C14769B|nr:hypothetical protein [Caulobacter sp. X]PIB96485.1 hypothetical protein CSW60_18425 [Caulobacter sp. X]
MTARFVIARAALSDETFESLPAMAARLLDMLADAGHGERSFKLRDCNAARGCEPHGPCLSIAVLDDAGAFLELGFAYAFITPPTADMHERLGAALTDIAQGALRHHKPQRSAA